MLDGEVVIFRGVTIEICADGAWQFYRAALAFVAFMVEWSFDSHITKIYSLCSKLSQSIWKYLSSVLSSHFIYAGSVSNIS